MIPVQGDILGDRFTARTLALGGHGAEVTATLVHLAAPRNTRGAVLYVHGFIDYFFQVEVAEHFAARGYDFYAVDLRAYGRSLQPGDEMPNFVTDLSVYFEELDAAVGALRDDGHQRVVVLAHSTGGLIASVWAHERGDDLGVEALVLNSPWLDLAENWLMRTVVTGVVDVVGAVLPHQVIMKGLSPVYGQSIHATHHGEWDYRTDWKPIEGFPVRAGWIRAVRRAHHRLHRGLQVPVPVLVLHSDKSLLHTKEWTPEAMRADTVLDVAQIARWAPQIGPDVTVVAVEGGLHDLFLSAEPVRRRALAVVDAWLDAKTSA
ncbi:MAG TPA: alpha/beta hydrolase [Acidimicrobiales bacterium]|nr:alpha/beta hydrolase [Acidimicrobiales bacterium]